MFIEGPKCCPPGSTTVFTPYLPTDCYYHPLTEQSAGVLVLVHFLELCCNSRPSYTILLSLCPFTDVRPVCSLKALLFFLFILCRHFPQYILCMSNLILVFASQTQTNTKRSSVKAHDQTILIQNTYRNSFCYYESMIKLIASKILRILFLLGIWYFLIWWLPFQTGYFRKSTTLFWDRHMLRLSLIFIFLWANSVTLGMTLHPFWLQLKNANYVHYIGLQWDYAHTVPCWCL